MEQLWDEIKAGNRNAFRKLFDNQYEILCLYAYRRLGDLEQAKDIVTESFIKIWEKRESIIIATSIERYLLIVVRNTLYSHKRKKSDIINTVSLDNCLDVSNNDSTDREKKILELKNALHKLPAQRRNILELAVFQELSYKEIAAKLEISINTVKTQMGRAYRFLREELSNKEELFLLFFNRF